MKKYILHIFTIICVGLLFYLLFFPKGYEFEKILISILALVLVALTCLNPRKNTKKKK